MAILGVEGELQLRVRLLVGEGGGEGQVTLVVV
jgi:hypothetical protein